MTLLKFSVIVFLVIMDIHLTLGYNGVNNNYIKCHQRRINSIYHIDCSHLKLTSVPKCQSLDVPDCTLITEMNLRNNRIEQIKNGSFMEFTNLLLLSLETNPILMFGNICWSNNHLVELDLSYMLVLFISGTMHCLKHLKYLNLSGIKALVTDSEIFQDLNSLQVLHLEETFTSFNTMLESGEKLFTQNKDLLYLELSHNGIVSLHLDIFKNLHQLQFLNLSYNQIQHVGDHFKNSTSLENVDISHNALTNIPMKIFSVLQRNMKINSSIKGILNISGNPFQCSCTLISEIRFGSKVKGQDNPHELYPRSFILHFAKWRKDFIF